MRSSFLQALLLMALLVPGCTFQTPPKPRAASPAATSAPPAITFVDVTREAGITFHHINGALGKFYYPENMGSGGAFLDYDRDGWLDILLINGCYWPGENPPGVAPPTLALYRNNGNGTFTEVTQAVGLAVSFYGMGVAVGDYDNDGYDDLYLSGLERGYLFHNTGMKQEAQGGRDKAPASSTPAPHLPTARYFRDVTEQAGVSNAGHWGVSCAWLDYDNDGDLDLFIGNYVRYRREKEIVCRAGGQRIYCGPLAYEADTCRLFRNRGARQEARGTRGQEVGSRKDASPSHPLTPSPPPLFEDVTRAAGIYKTTGKALGVAVWDLDGDRYPEIFVANDLTPNYLFRNRQKGRFEEVGTTAGIAYPMDGKVRSGMGIDLADIHNDGGCSLFISNFAYEINSLFTLKAPFTFLETSEEMGLGRPSLLSLGFGLCFGDYDNDGWKDAFVTNGHVQPDIARTEPEQRYAQRPLLFHNRPGQPFEEVSAAMGPAMQQETVGRGAVWGDYDNDGDLDLLVTANGRAPNLLRNEGGNRNHWLAIRLIGRQSNRNGIGAEVRVRVGRSTQRDQVRSGSSYLSAGERTLHFGLGNAAEADWVEVRWPSGHTDRRTHLRANRTLEIIEGQK